MKKKLWRYIFDNSLSNDDVITCDARLKEVLIIMMGDVVAHWKGQDSGKGCVHIHFRFIVGS